MNLTGNTLTVQADANGFSTSAFASASMNVVAGSHGVYGSINHDIGQTTVSAYAAGASTGSALAHLTMTALDDINATGDFDVTATAAYNEFVANANAQSLFMAPGNITVNGNVNVDGSASAYANTGMAYGSGVSQFLASGDIDVNGDVTVSGLGYANGTATGFAAADIMAIGNISVSGNVDVSADATNSFGPAGSGDANALAVLNVLASGTIDMGGISVNADALCSGNSGPCDAFANARGTVNSFGDITLSGPINVMSIAIDNNTGSVASATANLAIISSSGSVDVGDINVLASAVIDHGGGSALASANGFVFAFNSNTVSDITITANADGGSSGFASGQGYLLVQTATGNAGNNNLNGGLSVNVGLTGGSTAGYARLELDAAGSSGMNIAGPGFAIPHAEAGGASVTNVMSDIDTVNNATAELVIPHIIVTDNELTRRLVVTWLEASGFLLPTAFDSDSLGDGHVRAGGDTGGQHVMRNGTERSTIFGLPNGNGFGGFTVDDDGNIIFRASFGGLPDNASLPLPPDLCSTGEDNRHLYGILNCGWENEPVFY